MTASRVTRFEALLDAHPLAHDAAWIRARDTEERELNTARERYRTDVTDRAAHRCTGCGAWLHSVKPCRTPGCGP